MTHIKRFDHVGLTVSDIEVATAFFVALGLEVEGSTLLQGEFLDTVCGMQDACTEIAMLRAPDGSVRLELARFLRPDCTPGSPAAKANDLGLRNVAFEVGDLAAVLEWAASQGYRLIGGVGEYQGAWRMAHLRGPDGIVVSLSERIG